MITEAVSATRIEDLDIGAVWERLGGVPLRAGRGQAFWRDGRGLNVSVNLDKGTWFDHRNGIGGGILALVETVLGGRREALAWLKENFGVGTNLSADQRRHYARNIHLARAAAAAIVERRGAYLLDLRTASGLLLKRYHALNREAHAQGDVEILAAAETSFEKLDEIAERRDWLAAATGPELKTWFAAFESEAS